MFGMSINAAIHVCGLFSSHASHVFKKNSAFFYYEEFKVNKYICRDYFMNKAANAHGM